MTGGGADNRQHPLPNLEEAGGVSTVVGGPNTTMGPHIMTNMKNIDKKTKKRVSPVQEMR